MPRQFRLKTLFVATTVVAVLLAARSFVVGPLLILIVVCLYFVTAVILGRVIVWVVVGILWVFGYCKPPWVDEGDDELDSGDER